MIEDIFWWALCSHSRNGWPNVLRDRYIRLLQSTHGLSSKDLPLRLLSAEQRDLMAALDRWDPNREIFRAVHQQFERSGTKQHALFPLPDLQNPDRNCLRDICTTHHPYSLEEQAEDHSAEDSPQQWQIVACTSNSGTVEVVLGRCRTHGTGEFWTPDHLPRPTVDRLEGLLSDSAGVNVVLANLRVIIPAMERPLIVVGIDLSRNIIVMTHDRLVDETTGNSLPVEAVGAARKGALHKAAQHLGLSRTGKNRLAAVPESTVPLINAAVLAQLDRTNDNTLLMVRRTRRYHLHNETIDRLTQHVKVHLPNLNSRDTRKAAQDHYSYHDTFAGFFAKNPTFDADNAAHLGDVDTARNRRVTRSAYYAVLLRAPHAWEDGSQVGIMSAEIDPYTGEVETHNGSYEPQLERDFLERLARHAAEARS